MSNTKPKQQMTKTILAVQLRCRGCIFRTFVQICPCGETKSLEICSEMIKRNARKSCHTFSERYNFVIYKRSQWFGVFLGQKCRDTFSLISF